MSYCVYKIEIVNSYFPEFLEKFEDKNTIATLDVAIGKLKKARVSDTRKIGTNDWASRLGKVTTG